MFLNYTIVEWGRRAMRMGATYAVVQVITGIQVGLAAAAMAVFWGWPLEAALALAIPAGFPLMLGQVVLAGVFTRSPRVRLS
jgi:2-keto-4-pentenoate hydratase